VNAIARITLRRIELKLRMVYVSSMYVMDRVRRTVIEIETEDGIVGIGETLGTDEVFALAGKLAAGMIGQSPLARLKLRNGFARSVFDNRNGRTGWSAFAGLDLACWDIAGKTHGMSLAELLGGGGKRRIEVVCPLPALIVDRPVGRGELAAMFREHGNIDRLVTYALAQRRLHGFRCFKYKSAAAAVEWDVAAMAALREALGRDAQLRFDPNAGYGPARATALCARLEPLDLEFYEDPTDDIEGLAKLRARMTRPVATNMCVIQLDHLAPAIRHGAVDVVLADIFMWGGVQNYREMAAVAESCGLEVAVHSLFESGIGTAANLHLASGLPQITRANDSGHHVIADDILSPALPDVADGHLPLPAGPGLGVALDLAALARLTVEEPVIIGARRPS
jgi:glucarate dehydratase